MKQVTITNKTGNETLPEGNNGLAIAFTTFVFFAVIIASQFMGAF